MHSQLSFGGDYCQLIICLSLPRTDGLPATEDELVWGVVDWVSEYGTSDNIEVMVIELNVLDMEM